MSTKRSAPKSLTDLPSDVLVGILARLPLRTLIVSKSVCKTFRFLTTPNSHFNELHSSNAAQILVFQFVSYSNTSFILHMADLEVDYAATKKSELFHLPRVGENRYCLVNSCNGLVYFCMCWAGGDCVSMVCNPVTNEYIVIPGVDPQIRLDFPYSRMYLGFSPGSNEYKVLGICRSIYGDLGAQVFVIGSDSWRHIDATPIWGKDFFCNSTPPTLVNGFMYWHDKTWRNLVSFDFVREKFGEVALPLEVQEYQFRNECCTIIGVLGDCLCLSCNFYYDHRVDLWVMRDQNSWTKEFVFDTVRPSRGASFMPLQFLRNGEILMLMLCMETDLVCYDPKTETLRYLGSHKQFRSDVGTMVVVPLTPSFVPLKDTLNVDKVMIQQYVRPRGDENALSKEEGDFGTTNLFSRNLKKIQNMIVRLSLLWESQTTG